MAAHAATVTLTPTTQDAIIRSGQPDATACCLSLVIVGRDAGNEANSLFQFDLSSIPAGATITAADFGLDVIGGDSVATPFDVDVHRVTASWTEATVTWNLFGGAYDPTAEASLSVGDVGAYSWDLASLVQNWHTGARNNYGVLVRPRVPTDGLAKWIASREHGTPALRPRLVVNYTVGSTISGTVFEDVNYGGGAGADLATALTRAGPFTLERAGVTVELYDSGGSHVSASSPQFTDASGNYSFAGLTPGIYTVRVVNDTVTSTRPGSDGSELGVQTYRIGGAATVGGEQPADGDAPANSGADTLAELQAPANQWTESIATVDASGGDVSGVDFGFNFDTVVNANDAGQGSLRQFIFNTNTLTNVGLAQDGLPPGKESSLFMVPAGDLDGRGVATIPLTLVLPTLIDADTILDGGTQTANVGDTNPDGPEIELDGILVGGGAPRGVAVNAIGCTVRDLVINRFFDGVYFLGSSDGSRLEGSYIGTDVTGTVDLGCSRHGVVLGTGADGVVVGGISAGSGNLISGNTADGINIQGATAVQVLGNTIGTDVTGMVDLGNGSYGVNVLSSGSGNIIGSAGTDAGNLISGNNGGGLKFAGDGNTVHGNLIGTDSGGIDGIGGSTYGLYIDSGNNLIGGTAAGEANVVAYHSNSGVRVVSGVGNRISGNSIFSNGSLGIDLFGTGPNNGKLAPAIGSVTPVGADFVIVATTIAGDTVELFRANNAATPTVIPDASGAGEGYLYLGRCVDGGTCDGPHVSAVPDADPAAGIVRATILGSGAGPGDSISATATDAVNGTSEFSDVAVPRLSIVKRAFSSDGTPISSGATLPVGMPVKFMLYVNNPGGLVADVSLHDVLDPLFLYTAGSIMYDNSVSSCAAASCTAVEEAAILTAAESGTAGTDAVNGDVVSFTGVTLDAGNRYVANGQLDIAAGKVWVVVFTTRMQ